MQITIAIMYWIGTKPEEIYPRYVESPSPKYYITSDINESPRNCLYSKKNIISICATIKGVIEKHPHDIDNVILILTRKDPFYKYILSRFLATVLPESDFQKITIRDEIMKKGSRLSVKNLFFTILSDTADFLLLLVYSCFCKFWSNPVFLIY